MDISTKSSKLLASLNLMHHVLQYYGLTDECYGVMMNLCSKSRKLWQDNCNILASVTFNDDKYWTEITSDKEIDQSQAEFIIKYHFNLKFSLNLSSNSQESLDCMIQLLKSMKFIRFSRYSITLSETCVPSYNILIDLIKQKSFDLDKVSVQLSNVYKLYNEVNFLSNLELKYSDECNKTKHIKNLYFSESTEEISQNCYECNVDKIFINYKHAILFEKWINSQSIFTKKSITCLNIGKGYLPSEYILDEDMQMKVCDVLINLENISEVSITNNGYSMLAFIPILTKHWIEPMTKIKRECSPEYNNNISFKYERSRNNLSKLTLTLKNPIVGINITGDDSEMNFLTTELFEIDMYEFKYFQKLQTILVTEFRDFQLQGFTLIDSRPIEMIEIMKMSNFSRDCIPRKCCIAIKINPKFNSGVIKRLNSDMLFNTYESNKSCGFTIETCTSLSGIKANLLIGATKLNLTVLKETLKYFDQIHAYFTVFITFKPKLDEEFVKELLDTIFGLRVIELTLSTTFLRWEEHQYIFSLFNSKEITLENGEKELIQTKASTIIQHLIIQTKFDVSEEILKILKDCKFLRTLELSSMTACKNPDLLKEMVLANNEINISYTFKKSKICYGAKFLWTDK